MLGSWQLLGYYLIRSEGILKPYAGQEISTCESCNVNLEYWKKSIN
jgi:hypothetical protein